MDNQLQQPPSQVPPQNEPAVQRGASESTRIIVTILLLFFVTPIGVIVMWFWTKWNGWMKIIITVVAFLYTLFALAIIWGVGLMCCADPKSVPDKSKRAVQELKLTGRVVYLKDLHVNANGLKVGNLAISNLDGSNYQQLTSSDDISELWEVSPNNQFALINKVVGSKVVSDSGLYDFKQNKFIKIPFVGSLHFSADNNIYLIGSSLEKININNLSSKKVVDSPDTCSLTQLSPNEKLLSCFFSLKGWRDKTAKNSILNTTSNKLIELTPEGYGSPIGWDSNNGYFYAQNLKLYKYEASTGKRIKLGTLPKLWGTSLQELSPDGNKLLLLNVNDAGNLYLYSIKEGSYKNITNFEKGKYQYIRYARFSKDSSYITFVAEDKVPNSGFPEILDIYVVEPASGKLSLICTKKCGNPIFAN